MYGRNATRIPSMTIYIYNSHKHKRHAVPFAPSTAWAQVQWITPSDPWASIQRGWQEGARLGLVYFDKIKVLYLFLQLLVFLSNCSPAVKNDGRNGIHCQQRAPIIFFSFFTIDVAPRAWYVPNGWHIVLHRTSRIVLVNKVAGMLMSAVL
jgi:hypothetical protein